MVGVFGQLSVKTWTELITCFDRYMKLSLKQGPTINLSLVLSLPLKKKKKVLTL